MGFKIYIKYIYIYIWIGLVVAKKFAGYFIYEDSFVCEYLID